MILGAGPLQIPAIKKAKELNMRVVVCDYDANAVGFSLADKSYLISTVDQESVLAKAKEINPDYVITSTSDAPVRTAAYVSEALGLPTGISYQDAVCATVKSSMRIRLKERKVPIPKFYICNNEREYIESVKVFEKECIIKPSDSAASRGVMRITSDISRDELIAAYNYCCSFSKNGIVMVEELMYGPEVSVESFIIDGEVDIIAITDKMVTPFPYFVELGHSEQSLLNDSVKDEICKVTKQAIKAIGIINGVSHTELKITEDGPKIVEIAARLGGDYITSRLVPLSTGVDMVGNSLLLSMNKKVNLKRTRDNGSAIRFLEARAGIINKILIDDSIKKMSGIEELRIYAKEGDCVSNLHSSNDRVGHIITTGENAKEAILIAEEALKKIKIITI